MRNPNENDFSVDVEGIGRFMFARRTKEDVFKIRSRYAVLTESHYTADGSIADMGAYALVVLQTLMVSAPENFSLDSIDPLLDDNFEKKILGIYNPLRAKELSFRPKTAKGSEVEGQGARA